MGSAQALQMAHRELRTDVYAQSSVSEACSEVSSCMGKAFAGRMGHEAAQAPAPALCLRGRLDLPEDRSKSQLQAHRPSDVAAEDADRSENQIDQGDQGRANKRQSLGSPLPKKMVKQAWQLANHGLHHFGGMSCRELPTLSS